MRRRRIGKRRRRPSSRSIPTTSRRRARASRWRTRLPRAAAERYQGGRQARALVRPALQRVVRWQQAQDAKKSENVSVEFKDDTDGETRGKFLATADTYGADKLWVLLEPIAINLDSDDDDDEAGAGSSGDAPSSSSKRPKDDTTEAAFSPPPPPPWSRKPGSEAAPRAAPRTPN